MVLNASLRQIVRGNGMNRYGRKGNKYISVKLAVRVPGEQCRNQGEKMGNLVVFCIWRPGKQSCPVLRMLFSFFFKIN